MVTAAVLLWKIHHMYWSFISKLYLLALPIIEMSTTISELSLHEAVVLNLWVCYQFDIKCHLLYKKQLRVYGIMILQLIIVHNLHVVGKVILVCKRLGTTDLENKRYILYWMPISVKFTPFTMKFCVMEKTTKFLTSTSWISFSVKLGTGRLE